MKKNIFLWVIRIFIIIFVGVILSLFIYPPFAIFFMLLLPLNFVLIGIGILRLSSGDYFWSQNIFAVCWIMAGLSLITLIIMQFLRDTSSPLFNISAILFVISVVIMIFNRAFTPFILIRRQKK